MIATSEKLDAARKLESYRTIPAEAFQFIGAAGVGVYCLREHDDKPKLLCKVQETLDDEQLRQIRARDYVSLFVRKQDFSRISQELLAKVESVLSDATIAREVRFALLQIAFADEIERQFYKARLERYVALTQQVGKKISALLRPGEVSISDLYYQVHHNSAPYTHVTNVAAYAVVLAQSLEIAGPEELDQIATGCMLHEVGNLYLPQNILNAKGRLSARDHQELERAPQLAYEALCEFEGLELGQLMMAYQQHERVDGTGYPVRYLAEDIHPWAKLLAVVDVFDAMTNERAYRSALSLQDVLGHLADRANAHFAPEIVLCMISNFQSP